MDDVVRHEWLVTSALRGHASGTIAFCNTSGTTGSSFR